MKRLVLGLVLALALVAAACGDGDDDGGEASTDGGAGQEADGGEVTDTGADEDAPADAGTDGEGTDGGDADTGEDGTDGDDDGTDDGGGGSGDAAPRGGLAGAIYTLIVEDPDFDSDEFSEEQAACVANGAVDEVGEDRLNAYGITEETVGNTELDDIVFEEEDADALAQVFVECADILAVFQEGLGSGDAAEEQCIADAITEDDLVEFLSLGFQDREDESVNVLMGAAAGCIDLGGGLEIPEGGTVDDIMLQSLIDSLNLDDTQVACIEDQIESGLSIQTDIASIMITCNLG